MHIAEAQTKFAEDGYALRRVGPLRWAYFDLHDEGGEDVLAAEGDSPANAARELLKSRYQ